MPFLIIIGAATWLYFTHPALFAWNHTGFVTLLIFSGIILIVTVGRRQG